MDTVRTPGPTDVSRQVRLRRRPVGVPTPEDFELVTERLADLAPGEVRVRNEYFSVDPYMRGRMDTRPSYVAPYPLGETMTGGAVGRVVASADPGLPVGTLVAHLGGWRDVAQAPAAGFRPVPDDGLPLTTHLGVYGSTGHTAYAGLLDVAGMRPGEVVFVSGAAGAVGSIVGQIARLKGAARVIGSAGTDEKVALLRERYGFDAAFNYRSAPVVDQLGEAAPDGIDVYFDNVGGDHLEAALRHFTYGGRAAVCGAISQYNARESQPGPRYLENLVFRSVTLKGFILRDHLDSRPRFEREMAGWLRRGEVVHDETVVEGVDHAVDAFLSLLRGGNTGKMLVAV